MKLQKVLRNWAASAIAASALIATLTACQTASVPAEISLTGGNPAGSKITVDLMSFQPFNDAQREIKVQPGQHYVRVEKNGSVILDREVALAPGQTLQVAIP